MIDAKRLQELKLKLLGFELNSQDRKTIAEIIDSAMQPASAEVERIISLYSQGLVLAKNKGLGCLFVKNEDMQTILQALKQYQPMPCDTTSCEDDPDELYELAVYKRLGITSQRAYKLWQMEQDLINSGKDLNWELPSDFDKQKEKNTYCANIENAEPLKGTVGGTLQL